ncbi:MAG: ferredoxin--NADP reductase [Kangiellaceae bacterium]|jgi:ring-1,2-phenylacetyl-CoA epoxidase subunit PaaE|nr:ferredoxin--NADP reductase [Kangiellaceae bacterium]
MGAGLGLVPSATANKLLKHGRAINRVLPVAEINRLTDDSVSVEFKLPDGQLLDYRAGQYITVSKWLNGEQHTRCYSLCAGPNKGVLKIGVRHTKNGLMSGYINNELKAGDQLIVQGPFGDFIYPPTQDKVIKRLSLIAGGSGITPILSIIEQALDEASEFAIDLIYACRSRDSIMFFQRLESLKKLNLGRLTIRYVIESDDQDHAPLDLVGRLNGETIEQVWPHVCDENQQVKLHSEFYICGPEGLKNSVVKSLTEYGITEEHIHVEQFVMPMSEPVGEQFQVAIQLANGIRHSLEVAANQSVLEVAKFKGIQLPHACSSGTCGSCKLKVDSGKSVSIPDSIPGLTVDEKQAGITLACQCKPLEAMTLSET